MARPKSIIDESAIIVDYAIAIAERSTHGIGVRLAAKHFTQPRRIIEIAARHAFLSPRQYSRLHMAEAIAAARSDPCAVISAIASRYHVSAAALRRRLRSPD